MTARRVVLFFLILVFSAAVAFAAVVGKRVEKNVFPPERFVAQSTCGDCHDVIHGEWRGTMHASALKDPVFQAIASTLSAEAKTEAEKHEAELCVKCHAPIAYATGIATTAAEPFSPGDRHALADIQCDFCHSVSGVHEIKNTGHLLDPGQGEDEPGVKRGPRDDGACDYHQCEYSALHTRSAFCGGCHQVRHVVYDTPLETTYTEWLAGPYSTGDPATTVNCQDCHMRQAPGIPATGATARPDRPGQAAIDSPDRPHIWRHRTVGGNVFVPPLLGDDGTGVQMATERLQNCAALELAADGDWRRGETVALKVKVNNTGAGHDIPTGVTELRQVWLEVKVTDARGNTLFVSGAPGDDGRLPADTVLYHTALGDADGKPTVNIIKADRVLFDYRIPAGGFRLETYRFALPKKIKGDVTVQVRLRYRGLPQAIIDLLGESAPPVPIVEMTAASLTVAVR